MTLEYLELMEEMNQVKSEELRVKSSSRRKLQKSFKSNTRIYDDGSVRLRLTHRLRESRHKKT